MEFLIEVLLIVAVIFPAFCLGAVYRLYRRYYKVMKSQHHEDWWKLMSNDSAIELIGEWIRWPFGSWYLIASFFKIEETYNDQVITETKRKGILFFKLFVISFVMSFIVILILPKL